MPETLNKLGWAQPSPRTGGAPRAIADISREYRLGQWASSELAEPALLPKPPTRWRALEHRLTPGPLGPQGGLDHQPRPRRSRRERAAGRGSEIVPSAIVGVLAPSKPEVDASLISAE